MPKCAGDREIGKPPELCRSIVEKGFYIAWDAVGRLLDSPKSGVTRPESAERGAEVGKADSVPSVFPSSGAAREPAARAPRPWMAYNYHQLISEKHEE